MLWQRGEAHARTSKAGAGVVYRLSTWREEDGVEEFGPMGMPDSDRRKVGV